MSSWFDVRALDVPEDLFPTRRVKISLGGGKKADREKRRGELRKLRTWQAWDVFRAMADRRISVAEVARRIAQGGEAALAEIRADLERDLVGAIPTVEQEAERYLEWYGDPTRRSPRSHIQTTSRLKRFGEQARPDGTLMRDLAMTEVREADVDAAAAEVSPNPTTREMIRLAVSGLFTWSIGQEAEQARVDGRSPRWTVNPASGVERPKKRARRVTVATEAQVVALVAAAEIYQEAYFRAAVHLGLRRAELQHTRLHDDLDVERWIWRVQHRPEDERCGCPKCRRNGWGPKTGRSHREFEIPEDPPRLRSAILTYLEHYPAEPGDFVFRNPRTGGVWSDSAIERDFELLCERAGVRYGEKTPGGITLHTLRHTAATELLRAGARESYVAALLGDTVDEIVRTYIHITKGDLADTIRRSPRYEP